MAEHMKTSLLLVLALAAPISFAAPCKSTVTGDLQISSFPSKTFGDTATVRVWLPPGYNDAANAQKKYPVLYMLDGQNLFDVCTAFGQKHEWQVDEAMTELINAGKIPPRIVVGIDNAGADRANEYLPYQDFVYRTTPTEPAGKRFPTFLADEVLPYIAAKYRIESGPAYATIGGSSYGAVAALYAVLTRTDLFGSALLESTALQIGNGQLIRDTSPLPIGPVRVYVGVGSSEFSEHSELFGDNQRNAGFVKLSEMLAANFKGAVLNHPDVLFVVQEGGSHNEAAWSSRFPKAAEFLFGKH
jgi:predicted alpha/beta superfamily hydrolase